MLFTDSIPQATAKQVGPLRDGFKKTSLLFFSSASRLIQVTKVSNLDT